MPFQCKYDLDYPLQLLFFRLYSADGSHSSHGDTNLLIQWLNYCVAHVLLILGQEYIMQNRKNIFHIDEHFCVSTG